MFCVAVPQNVEYFHCAFLFTRYTSLLEKMFYRNLPRAIFPRDDTTGKMKVVTVLNFYNNDSSHNMR